MIRKVTRLGRIIELAGARVPSIMLLPESDVPLPAVLMLHGYSSSMISDPIASAKSLNGRPLLMLHGTNDRTIRREQAQRLYDAASEPKELRWYEAGHVLPPPAADDAALR